MVMSPANVPCPPSWHSKRVPLHCCPCLLLPLLLLPTLQLLLRVCCNVAVELRRHQPLQAVRRLLFATRSRGRLAHPHLIHCDLPSLSLTSSLFLSVPICECSLAMDHVRGSRQRNGPLPCGGVYLPGPCLQVVVTSIIATMAAF